MQSGRDLNKYNIFTFASKDTGIGGTPCPSPKHSVILVWVIQQLPVPCPCTCKLECVG